MLRPTALLIDIDGVLTISWRPIAGAVEGLAELRSKAVPMRFLTNTTSKTRAGVAESLAAAGFDVEVGEILTAPVATASYPRATHLAEVVPLF